MSESAPAEEPVEVADATGNEDDLVHTEFPEEEYPLPPQNDTDLGKEAVVEVKGESA